MYVPKLNPATLAATKQVAADVADVAAEPAAQPGSWSKARLAKYGTAGSLGVASVAAALTGNMALLGNVTAVAQQVVHSSGSIIGRGRFVVGTGLKIQDATQNNIVLRQIEQAATGVNVTSPLAKADARIVGTLASARELKLSSAAKTVRDGFIGATHDTVPLEGGTIRAPKWVDKLPFVEGKGGTVLTEDGWRESLRWGSKLGIVLTTLTVGAAATNVYSGLEQRDWDPGGILGTMQGRTGVLMTAGAVIGTAPATFAAFFRRNPAVIKDGIEIVARQSRGDAFLASDWLQKPMVKGVAYAAGFGTGPLLAANMLGQLNFLNTPAD